MLVTIYVHCSELEKLQNGEFTDCKMKPPNSDYLKLENDFNEFEFKNASTYVKYLAQVRLKKPAQIPGMVRRTC